MHRNSRDISVALPIAVIVLLVVCAVGEETHRQNHAKVPETATSGRTPEGLPVVPQPDASSVELPPKYRAEVVLANLTYPTSVEFDDLGAMYVAEGGYIYGDDVAPSRVLRVAANGSMETVADHLEGPVTDLLWHEKRLYISQRGKISVLESGRVRDLVTGLPSQGDHHNNQLTVGPDGKIYFGQGTATNSGVVGLDNFKMGWLAKYPEVHDVPAKDIRLSDQAFETPNPLTLLADKAHQANGNEHAGHDGATDKKESGHEQHNQKDSGKGQREHAEHGTSNETVKSKDHAGHNQQGAKKGNSGHDGHVANAKSAKANDHDDRAADKPQGAKKGIGGHQGHESGEESVKSSGHEGQTAKGTRKRAAGDEEHAADVKSTQAGEHEGHAAKGSEKGRGAHAGHQQAESSGMSSDHEGHGETPTQGHEMVKSFAFHPFAKTPPDDGAVLGTVKASGTILRMNADGSGLEMYAWGLRNPFGLMWGTEGKLYASDNGYDERGSRPIAHAPDCLWIIKQDAWYGCPDYAGGIPVTDTRFQPERGPAPQFLMRDHPNVEKPLLTLTHHVGAAKMDFSHSDSFGFAGHLFLALAGDMNPITGAHEDRSGFEVARIDPATGEVETFFNAKKEALGPRDMEYVVTAGPRRPVDVRFSADGDALYVVDVGAMAIVSTATGPAPRPFPRTGVVWRITRDEGTPAATSQAKPEGNLK